MEIKEMKEQPTLSIRTTTPVEKISQVFGEGYGKIAKFMQEKGIQFAGNPFAIYYNEDMQNLDIEFGFPVANAVEGEGDVKASKLPAGKAAVNLYTGPYSGIEKAYNELMKWMSDNGYKSVCGENGNMMCYEFYLNDPATTPPEELKTEIYFPIDE